MNEHKRGNRYLALQKGETRYHGNPCKKCGETLKGTKSGSCIPCTLKRQKTQKSKEWKKEFRNTEQQKEYQSKWRRESGSNAYHNIKRRKQLQHDLKELNNEERKKIRQIYRRAGEKGRDYEVDHIIPLYKGGKHHPSNLQILHISEHRIKSVKDTCELRTRNSNQNKG